MTLRRTTGTAGLLVAVGALVAPLLAVPADAAVEPLPCDLLRPYRDLDGDGFEDAVVGDPFATVDGLDDAGTVTIFFGGTDGRIGDSDRRRVLTQADLGETVEAGDQFGAAVTINRTTIEGCSGLVIGSPGEDVDGEDDAGMGHVLTLNAAAEGPQHDDAVNLDQGDMGGTVEADDLLGSSVAARGGRDEYPVTFAFGAPGENEGSGVVNRTDSALIGTSGVQERQGVRGVPGKAEADEHFGEAIAFGNYLPVDDAEAWYLYVGAPGDRISGKVAAGSVSAVSNFYDSRVITQNTSGVPGSVEPGDRFGASIALSKLPPLPDPRELAIGSPGEDVGSIKDGGSVTVLKRSGTKVLTATLLTQSTKGVAGSVEKGDLFGYALAYRDDRTLAIGVPGEDVGSVVDAGSVHVVRVGKSALSFPYPTITEDYPGTHGTVTAHHRFGAVVNALPSTDILPSTPPAGGYGEAIFALSSPYQGGGSVFVLSSTQPPTSWLPAAGQTGERFGLSVG